MKNIIKKTTKLIFSRALYLLIGLFLSVGVYSVYAAWNDTVSPNDPLTAAIWNQHVQKLIEVDNRLNTLEGGGGGLTQDNCQWIYISTCGHGCPAAGYFQAVCPVGYYMAGHSMYTWASYGTYNHRIYCCES